jgi:hypothetical protein
MKRRNALALAAMLVAGVSSSATSGDAARPVYKIDSVTASPEGAHKLVIDVKGAVRTGGWGSPHLRVKESSAPQPQMIVVFVAIPPPPSTMVVQSVLPVEAKITVPMPKPHVTVVKVAGETNSMTATIAH